MPVGTWGDPEPPAPAVADEGRPQHWLVLLLSLRAPWFLSSAVLLALRLNSSSADNGAAPAAEATSIPSIFAPLIACSFCSLLPSLWVLYTTYAFGRPLSPNVLEQYRSIVARKCVYVGLLRILFLVFLMLKLEGHLQWPYRIVCLPLWTQVLVVLVMLHTSIKQLNDDLCERAFKKQNTWSEVHLVASLFLSMKMDATLPWSWAATLWPLWVPVGMMVIMAATLTATLPVVVCLVYREGWGASSMLRGIRHPGVMLVSWSCCCVSSVCSLLFLVRVTEWLEGDGRGATDPFMTPVIVMLAYIVLLEGCMTYSNGLFRSDMSQLAWEHSHSGIHSPGAASPTSLPMPGGLGATAASVQEARVNSVMNQTKPKLLVRVGENLYRRPKPSETWG
eukprot:CAMPEP_0173438652 /NCGR_PEP_ID=MMETSP1357-20121228/20529_1 /TAXON_ID=77926 /ORGANISM="Hemiselmis rufescens, Strain PCC563" /LENGTH=391 /DNA_ID=CAMNT_0014403963 /DNA_START=37 /DNA_END=1209 /DNA_ORIENTATION=+